MNEIKIIEQNPQEDIEAEKISAIKRDLVEFSSQHKIPSLESRIGRGLDPIGIVALKETDEKVGALCKKLGVDHQDLVKIALDIQLGGPWEYSKRLKEAKDPAIEMWILLNAINTAEKEREMDLTDEEFLKDIERIKKALDEALEKPDKSLERSKEYVLEESKKRFRVEDGVPISEMDNGFIAMATNGYESGVIQDADGMLFVGAKNIDDEVFEKWGLKKEERDDGRGHIATFFVNNKGESVVKKLYPGFAIVLSRNFELAKAIVKASGVSEESLGHKIYHPTSMKEESVNLPDRIKRNKRITQEIAPEDLSEEERVRAQFYNALEFAKTQQIFRDKANTLIRKMKADGSGRITNDTLENQAGQTRRKVKQKMEELKYLTSLMGEELDNLSPNINRIIDMAGGAGDLGLAVSMEMFLRGREVKETDIVDPVEELAVFNKLIVQELPDSEKYQQVIEYKTETLQEAEVPEDAIVVAKHACGDLTDTIIEKWVQSESPMLVLMTCCQDKAKDQPARYNIAQDDWRKWCKESSKTNGSDPKKVAQGMEAMTKLDQARVDYLIRYGFDAKLVQTDKFPKGDVIIAKRTKNGKIKNTK